MLTLSTHQTQAIELPTKYRKLADWRQAVDYPALKPTELWTEKYEYLELAWEIIRRSQRYKVHHFRLSRDGLLDSDKFHGIKPHLTSLEPIGLPGWESIQVGVHNCVPPPKEGETLGAFVERHEGLSWRIIHGHWFVKHAWGISEVPAPWVEAKKLDCEALFAPARPSIELADDFLIGRHTVDALSPRVVRTHLAPREVLIKVRLDAPVSSQRSMVEEALKKARKEYRLTAKPKRLREQLSKAHLLLRIWDANEADGHVDWNRMRPLLQADIERLPKDVALFKVTWTGEGDATRGRSSRDVAYATVAHRWIENYSHKLLGEARDLVESSDGAALANYLVGIGLSGKLPPNVLRSTKARKTERL